MVDFIEAYLQTDFAEIMSKLETIFKNSIVQSVVIIIISLLLARVIGAVIKTRLLSADDDELDQRKKTILVLLNKIVRYTLFFLAGLQILEVLFGVKPTTVLTATGVVGIAVSLGAQDLIKDVIAGLFILFEDHYIVGDLVTLSDFTGYVHAMGLRATKLKNFNGDLLILRNAEISKVINHSRCERAVFIDVKIGLSEDIDAAARILSDMSREAMGQVEGLIEAPTVLGVCALDSDGMKLKLRAVCQAGTHFAVERELLRRIKYAFDSHGISIPYKHIVIAEK